MATSASSSSSRSSNSENEHDAFQDQDPTAAAQRLKLLDTYLLNSSLFDLEAVVVEPTKALEPVKAKHEQKDELQPESSVGNSAAPTRIALQEAEERWPTVADPRIRFVFPTAPSGSELIPTIPMRNRTVEDESKAVYKARQKAIKSVCIPGSTILEAKTIWVSLRQSNYSPPAFSPLSDTRAFLFLITIKGPLHPERVTHRRLVRAPNSTSDGLPRVAYFDYRPDTALPAPTGEPPKDPSKLAKSTKPINHRGLKRRGLRCDLKMRLLVKPILKEDKGVRKLPKRKAVKMGEPKKELVTKEAPPSGWTSLGRKRLSKKRRAKKAKDG